MECAITVFAYDSYTTPQDDYFGARIKTVSGSSRKNLEMISHMWNASMDTRRECFDVVHVHSTDPCLLVWLPRARYGIVATSHGKAYRRKKWGLPARTMSEIAERFFIHLPDVITSVSKPLADDYKHRYEKDVVYIPNGIKFREKPNKAFLKKWDIEPQKYLFCSAGRIERTKGLHTLFEAYNKSGTALPLVIAGGGSGTDHHYFEELNRNKPEGAKFVGFLTGNELYSLYAHARIFIFPSEYEAMSMTLLEGLSFGVPTVYSNIPENEAVAYGLGYSFVVGDADSLAQQVGCVLSHYGEAVEKGRKAKTSIRKRHDWGVIAQQYHEVYMKLGNASRRDRV